MPEIVIQHQDYVLVLSTISCPCFHWYRLRSKHLIVSLLFALLSSSLAIFCVHKLSIRVVEIIQYITLLSWHVKLSLKTSMKCLNISLLHSRLGTCAQFYLCKGFPQPHMWFATAAAHSNVEASEVAIPRPGLALVKTLEHLCVMWAVHKLSLQNDQGSKNDCTSQWMAFSHYQTCTPHWFTRLDSRRTATVSVEMMPCLGVWRGVLSPTSFRHSDIFSLPNWPECRMNEDTSICVLEHTV